MRHTTIRSASAFTDALRFNSIARKKLQSLVISKRSESLPGAEVTSECVTDPRDYAVPFPLFRGGIINEHAVHGTARPVAAIVPNAALADAGDDEEMRCDSLVDDARRR